MKNCFARVRAGQGSDTDVRTWYKKVQFPTSLGKGHLGGGKTDRRQISFLTEPGCSGGGKRQRDPNEGKWAYNPIKNKALKGKVAGIKRGRHDFNSNDKLGHVRGKKKNLIL